MVSMDLTLWITSLMALAIYSYLYKDNPIFKFVEHIIVGVIAGHSVVMGFQGIIDKGIIPISAGLFSPIIPMIFGVALFTRYFKKYSYLSLYPLSVLIGLGNGTAIRTIMQAQVIEQIKGITTNVFAGGNTLSLFNNILMVVMVICTISFFIFTKEQKGLLKVVSKLGINFMMICFGSVFAGKVLLFAPQVITIWNKILLDWLQLR